MSRIHEALQRAYRERGKLPVSEDDQIAELTITSVPEALPLIKHELVLENIAQHPWKPVTAAFPTLNDRGAIVEQFRRLRSHIYQAHAGTPVKTILIGSGMPSEGKTFVAANLAMSLARNSDNNILLIDGDLRRPTLHELLGAPNTPGLSDYLAGKVDLIDVMQRYRSPESGDDAGKEIISNLTFIPSGKASDNSSELVANHLIEELIATVSPHFDWIVIDSPPVLAVTDAVDLARAADAILVVAREASTRYDVAQRTQAAFSNSRILGFVLNAVKDAPRKGSYDYGYYYYNSESEGSDRSRKLKDRKE
ncbi:MAG: CpsD/CapB family tyrosine-protein kinase [Terracidiphilus sp.]|jgi:capsular exopolysaccharide synthesis family protein